MMTFAWEKEIDGLYKIEIGDIYRERQRQSCMRKRIREREKSDWERKGIYIEKERASVGFGGIYAPALWYIRGRERETEKDINKEKEREGKTENILS